MEHSLHTLIQAEIAEALISRHKVEPGEIAVITPYSAQKEEVKKQLGREGVEGVTVKTITDSQGKLCHLYRSCRPCTSAIHI